MDKTQNERDWQPSQVPPSLQQQPIVIKDMLRPVKNAQLTPYLGLQARLSQVWFNRWTVLLVLVLVRLLLLLQGLNSNLDDAKADALSSCTKVEDIGSAMASMPHYLSTGVNTLVADGITQTVQGLIDMLDLMLTGIEELILFVIDLQIGTYVCLITMAVHAGLNVSSVVVEKATDAVNDVLTPVADTIGDAVSDVEAGIDTLWEGIDAIASAFTGKTSKPSINLTSEINAIKNVKINSTGFVADLTTLNTDLPTFSDVMNFTDEVLSLPFAYVKEALKESYGNWSFDASVFPVAQKKELTFCSTNSSIDDFFDALYKIAHTAKVVVIAVLSILAVLACAVMAWWEIRRWGKMLQHQRLFEQQAFDYGDFAQLMARPTTSRMALKISKWLFPRHYDRQQMVRWCIAYGTSLPALFVLSLALAGYFSCIVQVIILKSIQKETPVLAQEVGNFANQVVGTLESVSVEWANESNAVVVSFQDEINDDVFGHVVNITAAVNNTINTFNTDLNKEINNIFGDTVFADAVKDVVYCVLGRKLEEVESGLTWVHNNAHVTLPEFPNNVYSLGANESNASGLSSFLATPGAITSDDITAAVDRVTNKWQSSLVQEALISTGLMLVYVVVVLIGICRTLFVLANPRSYEQSRQDNNEPDFPGGSGPVDMSGATKANDVAPEYYPPRPPQGQQSAGPPVVTTWTHHQRRPNNNDDAWDEYAVRDEKNGIELHHVPVGRPLTRPNGHNRKSSVASYEAEDLKQ